MRRRCKLCCRGAQGTEAASSSHILLSSPVRPGSSSPLRRRASKIIAADGPRDSRRKRRQAVREGRTVLIRFGGQARACSAGSRKRREHTADQPGACWPHFAELTASDLRRKLLVRTKEREFEFSLLFHLYD